MLDVWARAEWPSAGRRDARGVQQQAEGEAATSGVRRAGVETVAATRGRAREEGVRAQGLRCATPSLRCEPREPAHYQLQTALSPTSTADRVAVELQQRSGHLAGIGPSPVLPTEAAIGPAAAATAALYPQHALLSLAEALHAHRGRWRDLHPSPPSPAPGRAGSPRYKPQAVSPHLTSPCCDLAFGCRAFTRPTPGLVRVHRRSVSCTPGWTPPARATSLSMGPAAPAKPA
jgi:hypothetical protein